MTKYHGHPFTFHGKISAHYMIYYDDKLNVSWFPLTLHYKISAHYIVYYDDKL